MRWEKRTVGSHRWVLHLDGRIVGGIAIRDRQWPPASVPEVGPHWPWGIWRGWVSVAGELDVYDVLAMPEFYCVATRDWREARRMVEEAYTARCLQTAEVMLARMDGVPTPREERQRAQGY